MAGAHESDRLAALVDGRLSAIDTADVRAHLATCDACAASYAQQRHARAAVRSLASGPGVPASLSAGVAGALDREDAANRTASREVLAWIAAAAAVVLLLGGWWFWRPSDAPILRDARGHHDRVAGSGPAPDAVRASDPRALEAAFAERLGASPRIRVIDLAMMGWRLEAGQVVSIAGRSAALYTYVRSDGERVVCQMFEGALGEIPASSDVRHHRDVAFQVYERDGVTLVFWQEGRIVCVLASRLSGAEVVALAFEKAMAPG